MATYTKLTCHGLKGYLVQLKQVIQEKSGSYRNNKPESKFCAKCQYVLSFDAFNEAIEEKAKAAKEAEETKKRLEELEAKQEILQANAASYLSLNTGGHGSPIKGTNHNI
jgi:hypothetical protein